MRDLVKKINKIFIVLVLGNFIILFLCACVQNKDIATRTEPRTTSETQTISETPTRTKAQTLNYFTITEIYDWGPAIPRIIVDLGKKVAQDSVANVSFKVHVARVEKGTAGKVLGEGDRKITKVYVSDIEGNAVDSGNYVTIEMEIGPEIMIGSPMNYDTKTGLNSWIDCNYTITQLKDIQAGSEIITGLVINKDAGGIRKLVDDFTTAKMSFDDITLTYASYAPAKDNVRNPLIIWLHGMGEGGTDATIAISANKAVNFASEEIQSYFDGAYVLAPQTPTFWMDGLGGFGDGTSKYEKALMALIEDYVKNNDDIDTERIYIGGDSNGGYMTMLMVRDYTDYFAAAFPTCEALKDTLITDADIVRMKDIPMWFTAAKTDTVVKPEEYTIPTANRLIEAGAKNVQVSLFDNVIDTSGLYNTASGKPYEYFGHFSWIYVYNNQCTATINGDTITIMEWLAAQSLKK